MHPAFTRTAAAAAATFLLCLLSTVTAGGQAAPPRPDMAETVFKNVQFLKGIPVDEFMDTMGMFAAATAKDCSGCHSPEIYTGARDAFAIATPMIQKARGMIAMTQAINRSYFQNAKRVTCYTCHTGTSNPGRVPNLTIQYGDPPPENPNTLDFVALPEDANKVDEIFGRFMQALGGAQRVNAMTSLVVNGTYSGWDTARAQVPVEIVARAPNQMTTTVRRKEGNNTWVFDGRNAWFAGVDAAVSNYVTTYTGGNVTGARVDAMVMVAPGQLQRSMDSWKVSEGLIDEVPVMMLQGAKQGEMPVNLYFGEDGLLLRLVRWNDTTVGPIPIQFDFSDYRDVGGVKRPFKWVKTWTNNQATFTIRDMQINVPVDAARFTKPAPVVLK